MQFLRVVACQTYDEHAHIVDIPWREAGVLTITDKGERLLSLFSTPGIEYRIIDERDKLPEIH